MADIVGIGANVYDILITVPKFPNEDTKIKAHSIKKSGGGPCATGLVAASKLGGKTAFIGNVSDDAQGKFLIDDFEKYGVSTEYVSIKNGYDSFESHVILSEETVSRTCIFHRGNVPQTELGDEQINAIKNAKILMVDGNDIKAATEGAKIAKENNVKVLYDAGGLYEGIDELLENTDILIPSEEFALGKTGADSVSDAAKILYEKYNPEVVVITCGKKGGVMYDGEKISEYPAFLVDAVDSNGSGDVFHGAFAFSVSKEMKYYDACIFSSAVSAIKCMGLGARESVPTYEKTIEFLKGRGVNV